MTAYPDSLLVTLISVISHRSSAAVGGGDDTDCVFPDSDKCIAVYEYGRLRYYQFKPGVQSTPGANLLDLCEVKLLHYLPQVEA